MNGIEGNQVRKVGFEQLFSKDRKLIKIEPAIPCQDLKQLKERSPKTHQLMLKAFDIAERMYKNGLTPIMLGGLACALVSGNFYREHHDIDIALTYTNDDELKDLCNATSQLLSSFGYAVKPQMTFDNFFQFLLTDTEGYKFELDVFALKVSQSSNGCTFTPTSTSPFKMFVFDEDTLNSHMLDENNTIIITPTLHEMLEIKTSDKRGQGIKDVKVLRRRFLEQKLKI